MDEITKRVKEMYEQYPFPGCDMINVAYGNRIRDELKKRGFNTRNLAVLEAGCGSGEKAVSLAKVFSDSQIMGWDISSTSIEKAKALAVKENVKNIQFERVDLLNLDLNKYKDYFDLVISWGVIHHLSDSVKGMRNLGICLKAYTGVTVIWLYALHSLPKIETRMFQDAIKILLKKDGFTYEKGIEAANSLKGLLKSVNFGGKRDFLAHIKWFLDKNVDKKQIVLHILKNFRKIRFSSNYDINTVDVFLHANVKDYSIDMVFDETEKSGLEIIDFIEPPSKIEGFVKSEKIKNLYYGLDFIDRLRVMERIVNPGNHLFLARRKK